MIDSIRYSCVLLLVSMLLTTLPNQAQSIAANSNTRTSKATESAFFLKIYGLYGLLTTNPQIQYVDSYNLNLSSSPTAFQTYTTKLGLGPRAGIGVGFIVSDFINLGIDADMLISKTPVNTATQSYIDESSSIAAVSTSSIVSTLRLLSISPNITFKALSRPSYYIYNRLGIMGGMVLQYQSSESYSTTNFNSTYEGHSLIDYTKNSLSLGYQAALGIQFRLTQKLRGFAEVILYNQTFQPQEAHTKDNNSASAITTIFAEQGSYYRSTNQPSTLYQPSIKVAVTSLSAGIGLVYRP